MSDSNDIVLAALSMFKMGNVSFPHQTSIAKQLLKKYTKDDIIYALYLCKKKNVNISSLGYLKYGSTMKEAIEERKINKMRRDNADSGERNRNKRQLQQSISSKHREEYPLDLFTET